jgi:uncharacterized OsmC-like protein
MSEVFERQAPLRAAYKERPEEALARKSARTSTAAVPPGDPFHGEVEVGDGYGVSLRYGLDRYVGGLHDLPNPGDLLCAALAACQDGAVRMVAELFGVELEDLEVEVTGDLDVRGTLLVDPAVRVGFEALRCRARLRPAAGADPRMVEKLLEVAERVCVNADTLRGGAEVTVESELAGENEEKGVAPCPSSTSR